MQLRLTQLVLSQSFFREFLALPLESKFRSNLYCILLDSHYGCRPFEFRMDRWRLLQQCGLFSNLSLVVKHHAGEGVLMEISGTELPSIRFSPEVSFQASIERPQVSGGISWVDKNFLGLANQLEVVFSKKEGRERGTAGLAPSYLVRWRDRNLDHPDSSVSLSIEGDHSIEECNDVSYAEDGASRVPVGWRKVLLSCKG